jgi:hypothetical protein
MGYLNTREITVESVLTLKGREKIANGEPLGITKFALADDEVDYRLWRADHPNGSEFSGDVILNLPLFEAFVDETQVMRYKLVTLPRGTTRVPVVSVPSQEFILPQSGDQTEITPSTRNGSNDTLGYTAIIQNSDVATVQVAPGGSVQTTTGTIPVFLSDGDQTRTQTVVGRKFTVTAQPIRQAEQRTTLTIAGNETGGSIEVDIVVRSNQAQNA